MFTSAIFNVGKLAHKKNDHVQLNISRFVVLKYFGFNFQRNQME
jgi:hypothetical protein